MELKFLHSGFQLKVFFSSGAIWQYVETFWSLSHLRLRMGCCSVKPGMLLKVYSTQDSPPNKETLLRLKTLVYQDKELVCKTIPN